MVKKYCDRCGDEIKTNHFTLKMGCVEDGQGLLSMEGMALNVVENMALPRMLCQKCIFEIKEFVDKKNKRRSN